jgi:hypothetical protein
MLPPTGHEGAVTAPSQGAAALRGASSRVGFQVDGDAHGLAATTGLLHRAQSKDERGVGARVGTSWGGARGGEDERGPGTAKFVPRPILRTAMAKRRPASLQPLQIGGDTRSHVSTKTATLVDLYADAAGHVTSPSRFKLSQAMLAPADWFEDALSVPQVTG